MVTNRADSQYDYKVLTFLTFAFALNLILNLVFLNLNL
jgi:hypothetical protein